MRNLLKVGLRRLVSQAPRYPSGARAASVVAVAARKGGVGKTTTSVNLGAALARNHGKRVLIVDLDPQGHVETALARCMADAPQHGLAEVLQDESDMEVLSAAVPTTIAGLDVTRFDPRMAATEDLLGTRIGKEFVLRDKLKITATHYDVIILDCPPHMGNLSLNGLVAADWVVVPCDPSPLAVSGVEAVISHLTTISQRLNPTVDLLGVVLTRVDGRNTTLNASAVQQLQDAFGDILLPVQVGIASALGRAQHQGIDVFAYDASSRPARQYNELAGLLLERTAHGAQQGKHHAVS